jgi:hypothetical protein
MNLNDEQSKTLLNWLKNRQSDIMLEIEDLGELKPLLSLLDEEPKCKEHNMKDCRVCYPRLAEDWL